MKRAKQTVKILKKNSTRQCHRGVKIWVGAMQVEVVMLISAGFGAKSANTANAPFDTVTISRAATAAVNCKEDPAWITIHSDAQSFGALTGKVLTGAVIYFCVQLAATANIEKSTPTPMAALYFILVASVVGPLLLLNIVATVYLIAKSAAGPGLMALMWVVPLLANLTYPVLVGRDQAQRDALERAHPAISEYHVNLTGQSFWLSPLVETSPVKPAAFLNAYRKQTLEKRDDPMTEYVGQRLAPGFKRMKIYLREPHGAPDLMKPVHPGRWRDLSVVEKPDGSGTTSVLTYHYFHYPDRVEVVSTFHPLEPMYRARGLTVALLDVYPLNLSGATIARLQIDGQEIGLQAAREPDGVTDEIAIRFNRNDQITEWLRSFSPGEIKREKVVLARARTKHVIAVLIVGRSHSINLVSVFAMRQPVQQRQNQ